MNNHLYTYLIAITLLNIYLLIKVNRLYKRHEFLLKGSTKGFSDISKWINYINDKLKGDKDE